MSNFNQINVYQNLKNPNVESTITVENWLNMIQSSEHSELIRVARMYPKGSVQYNAIKSTLPCVTYNFLFDCYKKNSNIISSTGLLYVDIDGVDFDINMLDKTKIFAYYKSFGGNGFGILIKVNGLTIDNFTNTYQFILEDLNLSFYYDKEAVKATQYNVLSFDSDLFINVNCHIYEAIKNTPSPYVIEKNKIAYTKGLGEYESIHKIRFNNLNEIPIDGDYNVFSEGVDVIKCFIPMKQIKTGRNNSLLGYCNNLVYLNPWLCLEETMKIMQKVNIHMCSNPVDVKHLNRIVTSIFKYKEDGTLSPIFYHKKRKVIFNRDFKAKPIEKLIIAGKEMNKLKATQSQKRIYDALENWNFEEYGKITQLKVITVTKLNEKTVEKYWKLFKEYVTTLNNEFKTNKAPSGKENIEIDTLPMIDENSSTNVFKMDDEVDIKLFLAELYQKNNEQIDFDSILEFCYVLNKSRATILEIMERLLMVYKENRYKNSPYHKINIPRFLIEFADEMRLVA